MMISAQSQGVNRHLSRPATAADYDDADSWALVSNLSLVWSSSAPAGLRSGDFWAARFSFVLLAPVSSNYTLAFAVDDLVSVQIDDEMLLRAGGSRQAVIRLGRGFHDVVLHYLEAAGAASLLVTWDAGLPNTVSIPTYK